jgi:hypothetical protein
MFSNLMVMMQKIYSTYNDPKMMMQKRHLTRMRPTLIDSCLNSKVPIFLRTFFEDCLRKSVRKTMRFGMTMTRKATL